MARGPAHRSRRTSRWVRAAAALALTATPAAGAADAGSPAPIPVNGPAPECRADQAGEVRRQGADVLQCRAFAETLRWLAGAEHVPGSPVLPELACVTGTWRTLVSPVMYPWLVHDYSSRQAQVRGSILYQFRRDAARVLPDDLNITTTFVDPTIGATRTAYRLKGETSIRFLLIERDKIRVRSRDGVLELWAQRTRANRRVSDLAIWASSSDVLPPYLRFRCRGDRLVLSRTEFSGGEERALSITLQRVPE